MKRLVGYVMLGTNYIVLSVVENKSCVNILMKQH